jgi:hypothetical protein
VSNPGGGFRYLPGILETKRPLAVRIVGADGKTRGPLRRVERQHVARLVKTMRDI